MKTIPTALQAHLDSGATTMCYAWKVTRKDGTVQGFTDHDEDLSFDGVTFEAEAGFTASQMQSALGLSVDNLELVGGFNSNHIDETDLIAGEYDDADVVLYWVNWADTSQRIVAMAGNLGEVKQNGIEFTAELRSLTHRLNQKVGRKFQRTCDAVFCDSRCKLNAATFTFSGTVDTVSSPSAFTVTGLAQDDDYFSRGLVTWTSGANAGSTADVRTHTNDGAAVGIDLWTPQVGDIAPGDTFDILAGCKQTADVCKDKFGNLDNFQGFPHMPGQDVVTKYAKQGDEDNTGGALVF
ncbi:hypothetical protein [Paracoccus phage vB_PmaS-R3]|uniref:Bacteriophage phiJL001 Gp84 C-terminal domain-containing protein n=1 Tax=Paracoccus phage vB_PmaS-R3 TaxID=2494563 RepID=A0A0B5A5B8_9CAUD|nr:tail assembly protein [Paracoccus phage vB_PmaS-R3]AJD83174.1 hypothetical protein [Paracoccus phage vB_PmaS-R3]